MRGLGAGPRKLRAENGLEECLGLPFTEDTEGQRGS